MRTHLVLVRVRPGVQDLHGNMMTLRQKSVCRLFEIQNCMGDGVHQHSCALSCCHNQMAGNAVSMINVSDISQTNCQIEDEAAHIVKHRIGVQAEAHGDGSDALRSERVLRVDVRHLQSSTSAELRKMSQVA